MTESTMTLTPAAERPTPIRAMAAFLLCLALGPAATAAGAQRLTATIDRTEATVDSQLRLTVTVVNGGNAKPKLPALPDFDTISAGQTTQLQMVNGRTTASVRYDYLLAPKKTGTFTIPPVAVEIDGQRFTSQPITVRILEADRQPRDTRDAFVNATVSTTEPYVGQQVIYTWRFFNRVHFAEPQLDVPEFEGMLMESLGDVREYDATINGQHYRVNEFRRALFPQEEGKLTIPSTLLRLRVEVTDLRKRQRRSPFDSIFRRTITEPRVLRTEPIELTVRPRPAPPAEFSGLVGDFRLQAKISKQELQVGESATLTYTISGTGNAQMISEPQLPELPAFKIYDDQPTVNLNRLDSGLSGTKSYRKALVPLVPGELTLPPVSLSYFDVESGSYRTTRTPELTLRVRPAEGEEELRLTESMAPTTGKVAVRILADDILPVHRGLDAVESPLPGSGSRARIAFFGALVTPPLLFLGLLITHRRRERLALDAGWRRRRNALKTAREGLASLAQAPDGRTAAHDASRVLRGYIGDKLGLEGHALTAAEAAAHLQAAGAEPEMAAEAEEILTRLEAIQYGATGGAVHDLQQEIEGLLVRLETTLT